VKSICFSTKEVVETPLRAGKEVPRFMNVVPSPDSSGGRFTLLAPPQASIPWNFRRAESDRAFHARMLERVQKLRGKVYADDGAVLKSQLAPGGLHQEPVDKLAWHVLALDDCMRLHGCSRYLAHPASDTFSHLKVRNCPLAQSPLWGTRFRDAVESEMDVARRRGIAYVEVGGWALMPELRGSLGALRIVLATYSLARALGGCIGIATATQRHGSSSILRRIGGRPLSAGGVDLPSYYDPKYGCEMEILRFDSSEPNPRYESWIDELSDFLRMEPLIHCGDPSAYRFRSMGVPETSLFESSLVGAV
jgi:hypothetical protein